MHIFSPYRVCPLGAHVDHQHGIVTGFAIDKGVDLWFDVVESSRVTLRSETFAGDVAFDIATPTLVKQGNCGDYLVERTTIHAWPMPGGRFDIGSLDTYEEAKVKYAKEFSFDNKYLEF